MSTGAAESATKQAEATTPAAGEVAGTGTGEESKTNGETAAGNKGRGNKGGAGGKKGGNKANNNNNKRDDTPIEELYDLSKPIPKVDRPDKNAHDKAVDALTDAIEKAKKERQKVQKEIDDAMNDPAQKAKLQELRSEINKYKNEKNALINEKKELRTKLDKIRDQSDKILKDKKDARSSIKYSSVQEIDKEIQKLQKKQETTTMKLAEEKKLIKEIEALEASKKAVSELKNKDAAMDNAKEQRKLLQQQVNAKDKEIDAASAKVEKVMESIKAITDVESKKKGSLDALFKKREELKKIVADKLKERDAIRDEFREKNNKWYQYQRAVKAQKKIQYEEEKKKRDAERAEYEKKLEEEELKKVPYEDEQALCDYLADYLERTYLGKGDAAKDGEQAKKEESVAVKDDPFAGLKPVNKKADEEYFGTGKAKKKRERSVKKQDTAGPFTLSVDSFEQFGLLQLTPPTKVEQVANSVKELREKKEWYKQQPRGSVPTAAQIRKENEKAAAKLRHGAAAATNGEQEAKGKNRSGATNNKKGGGFNLSQEDFVPLGAGAGTASAGLISSWGTGKAPAAAPSAGGEDPTPAESQK